MDERAAPHDPSRMQANLAPVKKEIAVMTKRADRGKKDKSNKPKLTIKEKKEREKRKKEEKQKR